MKIKVRLFLLTLILLLVTTSLSAAINYNDFRVDISNSLGAGYTVQLDALKEGTNKNLYHALGLNYHFSSYTNPKSRLGFLINMNFGHILPGMDRDAANQAYPASFYSNFLVGGAIKLQKENLRGEFGLGVSGNIVSYSHVVNSIEEPGVYGAYGFGVYAGGSYYFTQRLALHVGLTTAVNVSLVVKDETGSQDSVNDKIIGSVYVSPHVSLGLKF